MNQLVQLAVATSQKLLMAAINNAEEVSLLNFQLQQIALH